MAMSPFKKPCIFCGGFYEEITVESKYGDYQLSSLIFNERSSKLMQIATCIVYRCSRCGNIQSFLKDMPET